MKSKNKSQSLSNDLMELFEHTPIWQESDSESLAKAAGKLDTDPLFQADYLKGLFVEQICQAMQEGGISQSDLARRWGKSRQYLSRVLAEDGRVNFTIETMVELAALVDRKLEQHLINPSEVTHVLRCQVRNPISVVMGNALTSSYLGGCFDDPLEINFKEKLDYESYLSA